MSFEWPPAEGSDDEFVPLEEGEEDRIVGLSYLMPQIHAFLALRGKRPSLPMESLCLQDCTNLDSIICTIHQMLVQYDSCSRLNV